MLFGVLRKRAVWIAFCAAALLFFFQNRAAYKGYFSADDLVNLGWPTFVGNDVFIDGLLSPKFDNDNFRPVGYAYYRYAGRAFQLNFPPYVAIVQLLHLFNAALLFFLLETLGFSSVVAGMGAVFFGFNAITLEAYWKPMYIFDVLCCTFCLVTLILYLRGRWIAALIPFWLAYKSKEVAVMLPVGLAACEFFIRQRKWKRLIPFFAISLSFGVQAMLHNRAVDSLSDYAISFAPWAVWKSLSFYSSAIFFVPFAGLAIFALPLFMRDKRLYIGLAITASMLLPMLGLFNRLRAVYWYVPLVGVAVVIAVIGSRLQRWAVVLAVLLWLPLNYAAVKEKRREVLAMADESRWFLTGLQQFKRSAGPLKAIVYEDTPEHLHVGIDAAMQLVFGRNVQSAWIDDPKARVLMNDVPMAVVTWYAPAHEVRAKLRTSAARE